MLPATYWPRTSCWPSCSGAIGASALSTLTFSSRMLSAERSLGGSMAIRQSSCKQVVLDHVAQLAGLIEVAPAAFDADGFGDGDLHVGDVVLVPLRLEQAVGEAQGDQVLHRVLAQVMIDAIGAVFREEARHRVVHLAGRLQVMADGFFQHHAGALGQPRLRQPGADRAVDGSRGGEEGDDAFGLAGLVRQRGEILARRKSMLR